MFLVALAMLPQSPAIYVAVDGNDRWSGRQPRPNRAMTDGPLATIKSAQLKARGKMTVVIEAGHYRLEAPLDFSGEFSTEYVADPPGKVFIDGSRRITGWSVDQRGWWHKRLPEVAAGKWNFIQLWVNGSRRLRPRWTHAGYATIADRAEPSVAAGGKGFDRFVFAAGELDSKWHALHDVEVLPIHSWSMGRMRIKSVEDASRIVQFTGASASTADWSAFPKGNKYIVENVREALGSPGEWYLDRPTGELTYIPLPGELPTNADVEAPVAESLVRGEGAVVSLDGITFEYTNWVTPERGHDFPQADIDVGACIDLTRSSVELYRCNIAHTGGYAVRFGSGCTNCSIFASTLFDLGGGGVMIGAGPGIPTAHDCSVQNCRLVSGGRLHPAGVGVWIGDSSNDVIQNNEVRDFYYTGVSVGWTWGYAPARSGNNRIVMNEISDIGQHVLSDMGGIYTLGDQTGTAIANNVIHDVSCQAYGGWGIYPDEGTSNELIEDNVVYRCQSAGFHQHYGKNNIVRNNVFALNGEYEIMRTRAEGHISFAFLHNIIAWETGQPFGSNWSGSGFEMTHNLYWRFGGDVGPLAQEPGAMIADPQFVDPARGDFSLRRGSPAFALGFQPIPDGRVGPQPDQNGFKPPAVKSASRSFPDPLANPVQR